MPTITIVFRGLMVLNKQPNGMEVGFVDALYKPGERHVHADGSNGAAHQEEGDDPFEDTIEDEPVHVPRILTVKNGVLASILDLRTRPELGTVRNWQLVVTNPVQPNVTTAQTVGAFNRLTHAADTDFRWITDLEQSPLHDRLLTAEINTRGLLLVLYVPSGNFYTRLKSPPLRLRKSGRDAGVYGCNASVIGCDINVAPGGTVKLVAGGTTGAEVFEFTPDANTVFEISNGPPDVPIEEPVPLDAPGHFHMYYEKLFNPPCDTFDFRMEDRAPAPDPTLCGVVFLGRRSDPL
jgi:hypothetical protein